MPKSVKAEDVIAENWITLENDRKIYYIIEPLLTVFWCAYLCVSFHERCDWSVVTGGVLPINWIANWSFIVVF